MRTIVLFFTTIMLFTISAYGQGGGSMSAPIVIASQSDNFTYSDIKNTNNYSNQFFTNLNTKLVFYKLTINSLMNIIIYHCGSDLKNTCIRLYDSEQKQIAISEKNDINELYCAENNQALLKANLLSPGTYYIASQGTNGQNGSITTQIRGEVFQKNFSIGAFSSDFEYSNTQNTTYGTNTWGYRPTNDIYYNFTIQQKMKVSISHCGSKLDQTCISLKGGPKNVSYTSCSNNGECSSATNAYFSQILEPGEYTVISEGTFNNGEIRTSIEGHPISERSLGSYNRTFIYTNSQDTKETDNNWGNSYNDIAYKFTISEKMDIIASQCGSELSQTVLLLYDANKVLKNSSTTNNGECPSTGNAYLKQTNLLPGTYYIVSEGKSGNGNITTNIQGLNYASDKTENKNYIKTRTYTNDENTNYLDNIGYLDGLGRAVQTVQKGITPSKKDLVIIQEYDKFGRDDKTWLPVPYAANGLFVDPIIIKHISQSSIYNDSNPYNETIYDNSPLNQIVNQISAGKEWYINGKSIRTEYGTNLGSSTSSVLTLTETDKDILGGAYLACNQIILKPGFSFKATPEKSLILYIDPSQCNQTQTISQTSVENSKLNNLNSGFLTCINYSITGIQLTRKGYYAQGELYVTLKEDEDGNISLEFKDKLNQIVLNRQINGTEKYDTYYVYDNNGNLRYVLPPLAVDKLTSDLNDSSEIMKQYSYLYKYDYRNRCIYKKLPGCDPIYYV
ncbi:MAG: DUF6443 domain-containing protein, partial [Dysgonomonas sp.]